MFGFIHIFGFFSFLLNLFKRRVNSFREWRIRKKYIPKQCSVSVKEVTDNEISRLGRDSFSKCGEKRSVFPVRNKKTGRVVMFSGTAKEVKKRFGDDYEVMDSAIKTSQNFSIDLDED